MQKITFQKRIDSLHELKNLSVIYGIIKNEKIKHDTEILIDRFSDQLRQGWTKETKKVYQNYKKAHFPVACFSLGGIDRDKTTKILPKFHTGIINLDLDENPKAELDRFKQHLHEFNFIQFCARSVSGLLTGHLWANIIVEIPKSFKDMPEVLRRDWPKETWLDTLHKTYILYAEHILTTSYGIKLGSAKDIKRARYLSYDPDPYSNPKAQPITLQELSAFYVSLPIPKEKPKAQQQPGPSKTVSDIVRRAALDTLNQFSHTSLHDRGNFIDFCMACKWEGLDYNDIDGIFKQNDGYDRTENERIYETLQPNGSKTFGSVVRLAKDSNPAFFKERRTYYKQLDKAHVDDIPDGLGLASKIGLTLHSLCDLSYSTLTDKIYINNKPITDPAFSWIYCNMVDRGFKSQEMIRQVLLRESNKKRFHPVRKFLHGLKWDGQERLTHENLSPYFQDKDGLFPHLLRKWLIGAINKIFHGSQNPMLVIVGMQGKGKSHFTKFLCPMPGYYLEAPIQPDNKDDLLRLAEKIVWEVSELGATTKRQDQEALKAFLSREVVIIRRPYDRFDIERVSMASFIGTVNDDGTGFLNDITGNRRFRVCHMTEINWNYTKELDAIQLWAEAMNAYQSGETHQIGEDATSIMQERISEHFEIREPMEDFIHECYHLTGDPEDYIKSIDLLNTLYDAGYKGKGARSDSMVLSKVTKKMGIEKSRHNSQRIYLGIRVKANYERG